MEKARILIVEDEAIVAVDLENTLTEIGYESVGRAVSAEDAINAAIAFEPDLILMDIVLKGKKNGIDASQVIKEKLDIPIIFLTAYSDHELLNKAKTTEPYAYIVKPFQERQLLASIEMSLYKKKIENRLKESEERFRSIAENTLEWIWEVDANGKYIYTSPGVEKVLGYRPEDILNNHFYDLFHPEDKEKDKNMLFGLFNKNWPFREFVNRNVHKNGQTVWLLSSGVPIHNNKGNFIGYRGAAIDITEEIRSEEKLRQTVTNLTNLNNNLEQIATLASYDLTETLQIVSENVQLLKWRYEDKLDANADEYFSRIKDGTSQIKMLIDDLLTYSNLKIQDKEFIPISCDMILDKALTNLQTIIDENEAVVTHDNLPIVFGDNTQLVRLFENLIDNAIKFRSEEPLHIHFSAEQKEKEWLFSVHDNGIVIDPEYTESIFKLFAPLGSIKKYPGTGIELAVCGRIVENHGGQIRMESEPDNGSTIYFTFPVKIGTNHEYAVSDY